MQGHDEIRPRHMLDAAREAASFMHGRTRDDLDLDRQLVLALVKSIEIVGEAASRITVSSRQELPQIPWGQIIGMRNRLVHAYFDINLDILWVTAQKDLSELIDLLESIPTKRIVQ